MGGRRRLRPALRALRHETLIGLLAVTGCRPGEALGLDRGDVDLDDGVVPVRAGKKHKQRRGAAARRAPSTRCAATPACVTPASRHRPRRRSSCPPAGGGWDARNSTRRSSSWSARSGWKGRGARARPRPMTSGMPLPCTRCWTGTAAGRTSTGGCRCCRRILGHVDPASTYWYLQAVPELLQLVGERLERLPGVSS